MHRYAFPLCIVVALIFAASCSQDQPTQPELSTATEQTTGVTIDPAAVAADLVARAGWELASGTDSDSRTGGPSPTGSGGSIISSTSEPLAGDIVHHTFLVQVGASLTPIGRSARAKPSFSSTATRSVSSSSCLAPHHPTQPMTTPLQFIWHNAISTFGGSIKIGSSRRPV
jgi:hypothetical protein